MNDTHRFQALAAASIAALANAACYAANENIPASEGSASEDSSSSGEDDAGATDGTTGFGEVTGSESDESSSSGPAENVPPRIVSFAVNGSSSPEIDAAQGVTLVVTAEDADGQVVKAEFYADEQLIGVVDGPAETFEAQWVVSGSAMNGLYEVSAVITDDAGAQASSEVFTQLDLPNGGVVDTWTVPQGVNYAVDVDPDGTNVVVAGQLDPEDQGIRFYVDRFVGEPWDNTTIPSVSFAADVVINDDGTAWIAAGFLATDGEDSRLYEFNADGDVLRYIDIDAGRSDTPQNAYDYPMAMHDDATGGLVMMGAYLPPTGDPQIASYVLKLDPGGEQEWLVWPTEQLDSGPFLYDMIVAEDGEILLVGSVQLDDRPHIWWGRLDENGEIASETTESAIFEGNGYSIDKHEPSGAVLVAGASRTSANADFRLWVRAYEPDGGVAWTKNGVAGISFAQAVGVDPLGNVASATVEGCQLYAEDSLYGTCSFHIRKYAADGALIWHEQAEGGLNRFNGPVLYAPGFKPDVKFDRFGYVYVTALNQTQVPQTTNWWVSKINP